MNWETLTTVVDKIGLVAVVVFAAYVFIRFVLGWLVDQFLGDKSVAQDPAESNDTREEGADPVGDVPGLHLLSDYGAEHTVVDTNPTEAVIRETIRRLDWVDGFYQVILVTSPGVFLEVGGSLDPGTGLSSLYRESRNNVYRVVREPPATVQAMEDLMISFHRGDGRWEQMYEFD